MHLTENPNDNKDSNFALSIFNLLFFCVSSTTSLCKTASSFCWFALLVSSCVDDDVDTTSSLNVSTDVKIVIVEEFVFEDQEKRYVLFQKFFEFNAAKLLHGSC